VKQHEKRIRKNKNLVAKTDAHGSGQVKVCKNRNLRSTGGDGRKSVRSNEKKPKGSWNPAVGRKGAAPSTPTGMDRVVEKKTFGQGDLLRRLVNRVKKVPARADLPWEKCRVPRDLEPEPHFQMGYRHQKISKVDGGKKGPPLVDSEIHRTTTKTW